MNGFKITLLFLFFCFLGCSTPNKTKDYTLKGFVFGTTYKITYLKGKQNYQKSIDSLFDKMNRSLSTYIADSKISKINAGDTTVVIDDYFKEVFLKSKRIFKETNGFFDPTVGNLVNAYGFGPGKPIKNLSKQTLQAELKLVGLNKVTLVNNNIKKTNKAIYLDFNSIAKGYGIDVVARFLESKNIANYLVEIGGEIRTKGQKSTGKPWVIKLVDPIESATNSGFKTINLSSKSMATSGNYRKYKITEDGKKIVHTINPKTGLAQESNLLSASVIAPLDCADVDAYATAFMAMGLEKTTAFLTTKPNLSVVLIYANAQGDLKEFTNF